MDRVQSIFEYSTVHHCTAVQYKHNTNQDYTTTLQVQCKIYGCNVCAKFSITPHHCISVRGTGMSEISI